MSVVNLFDNYIKDALDMRTLSRLHQDLEYGHQWFNVVITQQIEAKGK